jgi:hypothetical protein
MQSIIESRDVLISSINIYLFSLNLINSNETNSLAPRLKSNLSPFARTPTALIEATETLKLESVIDFFRNATIWA